MRVSVSCRFLKSHDSSCDLSPWMHRHIKRGVGRYETQYAALSKRTLDEPMQITPVCVCLATEQHHWPADPLWRVTVHGEGSRSEETSNMNRNIRFFFLSRCFFFYNLLGFLKKYIHFILLVVFCCGGLMRLWQPDFAVASTVESLFVQMAFKLFDCVNTFSKI